MSRLTPDADLEELQAKVYHAIELYLNPPVRYFSLKEMLDEGRCSDEIFNGPYVDFDFKCDGHAVFTKPGFIKDEDLEASELRRVIHVSDIINILMDIKGVVAIRNVLAAQIRRGREPGRAGERMEHGDHAEPSAGALDRALEVRVLQARHRLSRKGARVPSARSTICVRWRARPPMSNPIRC